ncbi:hypothetical protein BDV32DRAFT_153862 [Aspergillus pseudonomiae]|uniref:Uncharacterized protein n=1 Tax=Aspergillus pseudonomiae TaxID=1506151 RepID=A0A5N7DFZ1_9EURO|nr:uncharacterized protein BDV37DRAFT_282011 [Aspergillus pseudonomiae]KAB8255832.1 hypothetical protein BDV32DRAFT_153862 [Aspergillus pseudonomiae]KAE8405341.1 hypothetical protein BDV37DRAFT_282011 [Aspergillus pseudonomiae]
MNSKPDFPIIGCRSHIGYLPTAQSVYSNSLPTPRNWTPPSSVMQFDPSSHKQPSTASDSHTVTPAPKTQPTEPTNYADLLQLYLKIKTDVSSKFTLPKQEETTAPWVFQALTLLDHAENAAEAHLELVEALEGEIRVLRDLRDRMKQSAAYNTAVASAKNLIDVHRHDEEGVRIVQERVKALERFSMDADVLW